MDGKRLLQLSHDELPSLHVTKIGHQEIILQGVELLRNIVRLEYLGVALMCCLHVYIQSNFGKCLEDTLASTTGIVMIGTRLTTFSLYSLI